MPPRTPMEQLGPVLELLMDEPDPQSRERLLVRSVFETGIAASVAIYAEGEPWMRLLGCGTTAALPTPCQVAGVASGILDPELPPDGLVVVGGAPPFRRALAIVRMHGCEPQATRDDQADLLESLLMVLACLDADSPAGPDTDLADRVLPPFQRRDDADRSSCARVAPGLRDLLSTIRSRQGELGKTLGGSTEELEELFDVVERECQAAADLLLHAFAEPSASEPDDPSPPAPKNRWLRLFEERATRHAERLDAVGRSLSISGVDPGPVDLDISTEVFHSIVDALVTFVEHHTGTTGDAPPEIQISFGPMRRGARSDRRMGLQITSEVSCSSGLPRYQQRAEPAELPELRRHLRDLDGCMRHDGTSLLEVWLPFS